MKKKYKIKYKTIFILVFLILIIFCCVRFYTKGYQITYKIGPEKYEVKEIYTKGITNEIDNYYLELDINGIVYGFQFYKTFSKKRKVVDDILIYDGDYKCALPVIGKKTYTDLLCYKDNRYYFYNRIVGEEAALDEFVDSLDSSLYSKDSWLDKKEETEEKDAITIYKDNIVKDQILFITNLKGGYQLNSTVKEIGIFDKDVYQKDLSAFVSHYYVVADYQEMQQFRTFYFVDILTGKIEEQKAPNYISFDSYIQGIVEDQLYIYDRDNEKQYVINPKKKTIKEIGNSRKKIKYYENEEWEKITTTKANKKLVFQTVKEDLAFQKYDRVYHTGGEESGYYYLLEKEGDAYKLYRTPSQNKKLITYIGIVTNPNTLCFIDDYVYFMDGTFIKYYQDALGVRTVLEYRELEFNKNIIFGVSKK